MIVSSLSFNLVVKAIIISLYFNRSYLYRSTYTLSSSNYSRSFSKACIFLSYYSLMTFYYSSIALRNYNEFSMECPPTSIYEWIYLIFSSNFFFSSLSTKNCLLLASKAAIAAFLSYSALRLSSSSWTKRVLSTIPLLFS